MTDMEIVLCDECLFMSALGAPLSEEHDAEPLGKIPEGYLIGSLPCEHGYYCDSCDSPSSVPHFGRLCNGCDTSLAGNRYDYVLTWIG
jgi:hypothetical protein